MVETTATTTAWFPVVTLLMGFGASALGEWLRDVRTIRREREARQARRHEESHERRANFQRQTLLDLQESLFVLGRATGSIHHQDRMAYKTTGQWRRNAVTNDVDEGFREAQVRSAILSVRIQDEIVRDYVSRYRTLCVDIGMVGSPERAEAALVESITLHDKLNERIGMLLRELDDPSDDI